MKGRKPTLPNLKVIAGTDRPDRRQPDAPRFADVTDFPDPPQHLNMDGVAMWRELGPQFVAVKTLQSVDLYALEQLCYAWQRFRGKSKAGMDVTAAEDRALTALMSEFGMTPASRRRVVASVEGKPKNKFTANGQRPA